MEYVSDMLKIQTKDAFHLIHYFLFIKIKGLNIITCKGYDLLDIILMCLFTAIENSLYSLFLAIKTEFPLSY